MGKWGEGIVAVVFFLGGVGLLSTGHLVYPKPFPEIWRGIKRAVQNNNLPFAVPDSRHWLPKASNGPSTILMHTHSACILGGVEF